MATGRRGRTGVLVDTAPLVTVQADEPSPSSTFDRPILNLPIETNQSPQRLTMLGMITNLVTGGLGAGILTLPWGMAGASAIVVVTTMIAVIALNCFTIMLLVYAAEAHKSFDLGSLLCKLPGRNLGPTAQGVCNALVWLTIWMLLVGYIIVVQDSLTPLFPAHSVLSNRWAWGILASLVVLPLSLVDLRFLSMTSSPLSVGVNAYLFGLLCVRLASDGISPDGPCIMARLDPPPTGVFAFISLMSNTIIIQMVCCMHGLGLDHQANGIDGGMQT